MFPHLIIKGRIRSATALKKRGSIGQGLDKLVEEGDHALGGLDRDGQSIYSAAANFFLLKSKAPVVNQDQMFEFLESFFGQGDGRTSDSAELLRIKSNESELKYHYNLGYKQINEAIKGRIR